MQKLQWLSGKSTTLAFASLLILVLISLTALQGLSCAPPQSESPAAVHSEGSVQTPTQSPTLQPDQSVLPPSSTETQPQSETKQLPLVSDPAISDSINIPITPTEELATTGGMHVIDIATYRLTVEGIVENPLTLTYDEVLKYPAVTATILLVCPNLFTNNAQWTGVPVKALLTAAGLKQGVTKIIFVGVDGYKQSLSPGETQEPGVFLAYLVNGKALPPEQGFPLRLVVKGQYGSIWVKWVERIIVN